LLISENRGGLYHTTDVRIADDPGIGRSQARFSFLIQFWALSSGSVRVARDPAAIPS